MKAAAQARRKTWAALLVLVPLVAGCAAPPDSGPRSVVLLDPSEPIAGTWRHGVFGRATQYSLASAGGRAAIHAVGRKSASGLYRRARFTPADCPWIEWSWRVDRMQPGADIRVKQADDVAASVFFLFGDPGLTFETVPTLRYAWTIHRVAAGAVLDNPFYPGKVRVVVVRSGDAQLGEWVSERRNLVEDYTRAFGRAPSDEVELFAVFTDNDQTREPVEAFYGAASAHCGPAPAG